METKQEPIIYKQNATFKIDLIVWKLSIESAPRIPASLFKIDLIVWKRMVN